MQHIRVIYASLIGIHADKCFRTWFHIPCTEIIQSACTVIVFPCIQVMIFRITPACQQFPIGIAAIGVTEPSVGIHQAPYITMSVIQVGGCLISSCVCCSQGSVLICLCQYLSRLIVILKINIQQLFNTNLK